MTKFSQEKLWPGTNCSILEIIERDIALVDAQTATLAANAAIAVDGACMVGAGSARSSLGAGTHHATVQTRGEERHTYRLIAEPGCEVQDCLIRVKCRAQGQIAGVLEDSAMHVEAEGSFRVCGHQFPFSFRVDPTPSPGEEQGELELEVNLNPDEADVDGKIKYIWKKIVGDSDTWSGPDYEEEETQSCTSGLVELSAHTSMTLQVYNQDWNNDGCSINADMECSIRTMSVQVTCACPEPKDRKSASEDGRERGAMNEQMRQVQQWKAAILQQLESIESDEPVPPKSVADEHVPAALDRMGNVMVSPEHVRAYRSLAAEINVATDESRTQGLAARDVNRIRRSLLRGQLRVAERIQRDLASGHRLGEGGLAAVRQALERRPQTAQKTKGSTR